jgi:hypothetical protein
MPYQWVWNGSYIHCHGFHDMRKPWAMTVTLDSRMITVTLATVTEYCDHAMMSRRSAGAGDVAGPPGVDARVPGRRHSLTRRGRE